MKATSLIFRAPRFYGNRFDHRGQWWIHRELRTLFKANADANFTVSRGGLRWVLNPSDYTEPDLFRIGRHDRWDSHHLVNLLQPQSLVFDVGANFGYYSIMLAARTLGEVYAFEPNPATFTRLTTNISLNGLAKRVRPFRIALSDREGVTFMRCPAGNSAAARIDANAGNVAVELLTLNEFWDARRVDRLDLVKINVEGLEEEVLRGADGCLNRLRPLVFIELFPHVLARQESSAERVIDLLHKYGYRLYISARKRLLPLGKLPREDEVTTHSVSTRAKARCNSRGKNRCQELSSPAAIV